ncbi:hypothetical protein CCP1ISM_100004 [Azospirillaceae bacterium]
MTIPTSFDRRPERPVLNQGPAGVETAIRQASAETGVNFAYLMEKAAVESSMRPDLKAATSSATGLYQFIDSTWLNTLKQHGAEHGLGQYADAIQRRSDGRCFVADPAQRQEILDLRKDPRASALMAAELTRDNQNYLQSHVQGPIGPTELYMAHFLGAAGASRFLNALHADPNRAASDVVPEAAGSNTAVFYDRDSGQSKSLAQVYQRFAKKFQEGDGGTLVASRGNGGTDRSQDPIDVFSRTGRTSPPGGAPLTNYTMLALAALQTPDESKSDRRGSEDNRRIPYDAHRFNPLKAYREQVPGAVL